MGFYVHKYGGTSVGSLERIQAVAERIVEAKKQGHDIVVVVSAMAGETNRLTTLGQTLDPEASLREMDVLLATGEQVTVALLAIALQKLGCPAISLTSDQVGIQTSSDHSKARIESIDTEKILSYSKRNLVVVITGFQGRSDDNQITTLGRGGSDTSAVAIAAALKADECLIYTDVDGVYTTDPRIEPHARCLEHISFEEMQEMASLGAKVLQIRAVEYAGKHQVPLRVLSSFNENSGTLISYEKVGENQNQVTGIAFNADEACLTVQNVPQGAKHVADILAPLSAANIDIDIIVQNSVLKEQTDLTFTLEKKDYQKAHALLEKNVAKFGEFEVKGIDNTAKVSIVGAGMWRYPGVATKMFATLEQAGIHIYLVSTSEIKVSVIVAQHDMQNAVRLLHKTFNLEIP